MIVGATIPWPGSDVGCFDPAMVLRRLGEVFGDDLEFDRNDLFEGHYERRGTGRDGAGDPLGSPCRPFGGSQGTGAEPALSVPPAGGSGILRLGHGRSLLDHRLVRQRGRVPRAGSQPVYPVPGMSEVGRHSSLRGVVCGRAATAGCRQPFGAPGLEAVDYRWRGRSARDDVGR